MCTAKSLKRSWLNEKSSNGAVEGRYIFRDEVYEAKQGQK